MSPLPIVFAVLSGVCLVAALAATWGSLRATLAGEAGARFGGTDELPDRAALRDEKAALLRAIKDLAEERAVGKLDDADFARLDRAYRARAKEVLALLEEGVAPYRAEAERLIEARLAEGAGARAAGRGKAARARDAASADAAPREPNPGATDASATDVGATETTDPSAVAQTAGAAETGDPRPTSDESDEEAAS